MNNPMARGCIVSIAGMVLITAGFLITAAGIRAIINGDHGAFYMAISGLVAILFVTGAFMWSINNHMPGHGGLFPTPPPREGEFFEKEKL